MSDQNERDPIGVLWERESRFGKKRLTGNVSIGGQRVQVVAFKNNKQGNAKRPDWLVFLDTRDPDMNADPATGRPLATPPKDPHDHTDALRKASESGPQVGGLPPEDGDDIPF